MIGSQWAGNAGETSTTRIAVVTGSRADFGLLTPVMCAIEAHDNLELLVIAAGAHLISPATTFHDIKREFLVADSVPMQTAGKIGRFADVESLGRGITRFGRSFEANQPACVVVLGDRIEAFAAASAAAIAGIPLAHIHGGDRAEGVADESMRHAITKLAHLHFPATAESADRIRKMGEPEDTIFTVGSPAVDGIELIAPMTNEECDALFGPEHRPDAIILHHPAGLDEEREYMLAHAVVTGTLESIRGPILCLAPNHDPGRETVVRAQDDAIAADADPSRVFRTAHLPRQAFLRLLKRLADQGRDAGSFMIGNSSAGLIEAPSMGVRVVNVGPRQAGRERPECVVTACETDAQAQTHGRLDEVNAAIREAQASTPSLDTRYGNGDAGVRIAKTLAAQAAAPARSIRKRNVY